MGLTCGRARGNAWKMKEIFTSEAQILRLGEEFAALTLPREEWTHAAHFAAALFNAFVADGGPAQINISSKLRQECRTALATAAATGGVPPANLFTAIKTEIRALEIENTLRAFQLLLQQAMAPNVAGAGAGVK